MASLLRSADLMATTPVAGGQGHIELLVGAKVKDEKGEKDGGQIEVQGQWREPAPVSTVLWLEGTATLHHGDWETVSDWERICECSRVPKGRCDQDRRAETVTTGTVARWRQQFTTVCSRRGLFMM